jgi:hypothetical protein
MDETITGNYSWLPLTKITVMVDFLLSKQLNTRKTISSMKPQPHLSSDQSHKEKLAKDLTTSQQTDQITFLRSF